MAAGGKKTVRRRIAIVGGGISGLGAAWALHRDRFDFRLLEAQDRIGGNNCYSAPGGGGSWRGLVRA
ncbi:FAD-dependent oxidoreductase [Candidatus Palauibacter sp.]|uniref:FAD-dependent oxidoreductase n=1 Tax=Candidatus Palauibacter sp. TaxID=3101350 RepID=UPI003AF279A7